MPWSSVKCMIFLLIFYFLVGGGLLIAPVEHSLLHFANLKSQGGVS